MKYGKYLALFNEHPDIREIMRTGLFGPITNNGQLKHVIRKFIRFIAYRPFTDLSLLDASHVKALDRGSYKEVTYSICWTRRDSFELQCCIVTEGTSIHGAIAYVNADNPFGVSWRYIVKLSTTASSFYGSPECVEIFPFPADFDCRLS